MSKKSVEDLLVAGGENESVRTKYDPLKTMEEFVALAKEDGYDFTEEELAAVLQESGDSFESYGNPPKRTIWWY